MVHSQKAEILYQLVVEKKKDDWNNLPRLYTSNDFVSSYLVIDVSLLGGAKAKPSQGTNVNCCFLPLNELNGVQCMIKRWQTAQLVPFSYSFTQEVHVHIGLFIH